MDTQTKGHGWFDVECVNPDGSIAWRESFPNGMTTAGMTDRLNVAFAAGAQHAAWYLGLIDNAGFSALATGDTMASHAGWSESVAYAGATRPQWTPLAVAAASVVNSAAVSFTMNGTATIKGAFLASDSTLSGVAGVLWAHGVFGSTQAVVNGQVLTVTYRHTDS